MKRMKTAGLLLMLFGLLSLSSCEKSVSENLVGIWQINNAMIDGVDAGDGKGWLDFKADGKVDTRISGTGYQSGTYTVDTENMKLAMTADGTSRTYDLTMDGSKMQMDGEIVPGKIMSLVCQKVDDYPITKEQEMKEMGIEPPAE